jgi:hypothetical protein
MIFNACHCFFYSNRRKLRLNAAYLTKCPNKCIAEIACATNLANNKMAGVLNKVIMFVIV